MTSTIRARQASNTLHAVVAMRGPRLDRTTHATSAPFQTTRPHPRNRTQPQVAPLLGGLAIGAETMPCMDRLNSLIAFYQMELPVTDAQLPHWNAFADAVRSRAMRLQQLAGAGTAIAQPALRDRPKDRAAWLSAELETMTAILSAAQPLYAAMSPEQQAVVEALAAARAGMQLCDA